jgi:hypothetical protein
MLMVVEACPEIADTIEHAAEENFNFGAAASAAHSK